MLASSLFAAMLAVGLLTPALAQNQSSPAQPEDRPGEVYKRLLRPLDHVRSSLDNWSPAELAALAAGIRQAQQYCARVLPASVSGDDLYQLARVCAFGQQWNAADTAASLYIKGASAPWQAHAYAVRINALLNLKDSTMATEVARSMLRSLPYDATVDQSLTYLVHYLAMGLEDAALPLARERQPALLAALKAGHGLKEENGDAVLGATSLYGEGMQLIYLARYASKDDEAAQSLAALDAALAAFPPAQVDNQAEIARVRLQYALLGERLPAIRLLPDSASPARKPHPRHNLDHDFGNATVLLIFPQWCPQCIAMMQPLTTFAVRNGGNHFHAYGILALDQDKKQDQDPATANPFKSDPLKALESSPTLLLASADTLDRFAVSALPFAVITDGSGRVRFVGEVPLKAFDADGFLEQMIDKVVAKPPNTPP